MAKGTIFLAVAEEASVTVLNPIIYVGGGIAPWASFGFGNWNQLIWTVDEDGVAVAGTGNDYDGYSEST